jgi:predicted nuclease of predicted toxin-antitoxin system
VKLLVEVNLSPRRIDWLTNAGFAAVHWTSVGPGQAPDPVIMAYAKEHGCIVLTQDLDFGAILAATRDARPGVVQIRSDNLSPDAIGDRVVTALRQLEPGLRTGALATIDPARTRMSLLPLRRDD